MVHTVPGTKCYITVRSVEVLVLKYCTALHCVVCCIGRTGRCGSRGYPGGGREATGTEGFSGSGDGGDRVNEHVRPKRCVSYTTSCGVLAYLLYCYIWMKHQHIPLVSQVIKSSLYVHSCGLLVVVCGVRIGWLLMTLVRFGLRIEAAGKCCFYEDTGTSFCFASLGVMFCKRRGQFLFRDLQTGML